MIHLFYSLASIFAMVLFVFIIRSFIIKLIPNKRKYILGITLTLFITFLGLAFFRPNTIIEQNIIFFMLIYFCIEKFSPDKSHIKETAKAHKQTTQKQQTRKNTAKSPSTKKTSTYYTILNIEKNATSEEIRKAFKTMAKKYHPDHNSSPNASVQFRKIKEAYDTLINPKKRIQYDEKINKGDI